MSTVHFCYDLKKYSVYVMWSDEDDGYIAIVPELSEVSAYGDTREEAIEELEIALACVLDVMDEDGTPRPRPTKYGTLAGAGQASSLVLWAERAHYKAEVERLTEELTAIRKKGKDV